MKMRAKQQQPCVPIGSDNPICSPGAEAVSRVYFMGLEALAQGCEEQGQTQWKEVADLMSSR